MLTCMRVFSKCYLQFIIRKDEASSISKLLSQDANIGRYRDDNIIDASRKYAISDNRKLAVSYRRMENVIET